MSRLPQTLPADVHVATWRDYPRLLRIACALQVRVMRLQPAMGWMFVVAMVLLVAEGAWLSSLNGAAMPDALLWGIGVIPVILALAVLFLVAHTAWGLLDRNRLVLLSSTRGSVLHVRFGRDGSIAPSNHGRLRGDRSAPGLRAAVATWIRSLAIGRATFLAQNAKVAALYAAQIPELAVGTTDALGRVRLSFSRDHDAGDAASG